MIDPFHLEAYNIKSINYNRDVESFPVLKRIIEKITGKESVYKSPTDMGVNRVGFGIIDDEVVKEASRQEVIRRYFKTNCEYKKGYVNKDTLERTKLIMEELNLKESDRKIVAIARDYAQKVKETSESKDNITIVGLDLPDGTTLTGKSSEYMEGTAAAVINAIKHFANIDDSMHLISPVVLEPIINLKSKTLGFTRATLNCEEVLMAVSIGAATNPMAQVALEKLTMLTGTQAHSTTIVGTSDEQTYRKLGIDVTADAEYATDSLLTN